MFGEIEWKAHVDIEKPPKYSTGGPYYTLSAIVDESTGVGLSESYRIAEYLDKAYPDTPKVIIPGTEALLSAFITSLRPHLKALWQFTLPASLELINHPSMEHFLKTRSKRFGRDISTSNGPYVMGDTMSFADFVLCACFKWMQVALGKDSEEWKQINS